MFPSRSRLLRGCLLLVAAWLIPARLPAAPELDRYFPCQEGDEWTMNAAITLPGDVTRKALAHRGLEETIEDSGKTYLRMVTWMEGEISTPTETQFVRKDDHGLYTLASLGGEEALETPIPLKPGDTWEKTSKGVKSKYTVIGLESVQIGDRTYADCYHIRIEAQDGSIAEDLWEAPDVGSVKSVLVLKEGVKIVLTLKQFKSKKQ